MNVLVVYAHHEPGSFTTSLKNVAVSVLQAQGHEVVETDLYALGFHPVANKYDFTTLSGQHFNYMLEQKHAAENSWAFAPDIVSEMQKVQAADTILFYSPVWWSGLPAIMKGWLDRVLAMGVAWDSGDIFEHGHLRGKRALLTAVSGIPEEDYQPLGKHKATLRQMFHPLLHGTFAFCGMDVLEPFFVYSSMNRTSEEYQSILDNHRQLIENLYTSPRYLSKY